MTGIKLLQLTKSFQMTGNLSYGTSSLPSPTTDNNEMKKKKNNNNNNIQDLVDSKVYINVYKALDDQLYIPTLISLVDSNV